jgi:hypothetical protein
VQPGVSDGSHGSDSSARRLRARLVGGGGLG